MTLAAALPHRVFVDRQKATPLRCPSRHRLTTWVQAALVDQPPSEDVALAIRWVDEPEGQSLNQQYRHKNYATNVLSFPFDAAGLPDELQQERYLGDLVVCMPVLIREAAEQNKTLTAHTAHIVVHGVLHLLGYDHETSTEDAEAMEALEIQALQRLGFGNPYETFTGNLS